MKILVTGAKGQLGSDVIKELEKRGHQAIGCDVEEMNITDGERVSWVIRRGAPDAVIHCAAYTDVDGAEDRAALCRRVNARGTENIAKVCGELDLPLMYISTDYVFDGQGERPWEPDDERNPLNVYGITKFEGELAVEKYTDKYFTVRIAWVYGLNGSNFVKTMLKLSESHDVLTVVDDQIGSPTYTPHLARLLVDMIGTDRYGRYHATNEGLCSWADFAREIFKQAGKQVTVIPVASTEYPSKAKRPMNSRMSKDKLVENGFKRLPDWKTALKEYLGEIL